MFKNFNTKMKGIFTAIAFVFLTVFGTVTAPVPVAAAEQEIVVVEDTRYVANAGDTNGTGIITTIIDDYISPWMISIGACICLIGLIQFALAFQRQDSEGKSQALMVIMSGAMIVGVGLGASTLFSTFQKG